MGSAIYSKDFIAVPGYISDIQLSDTTITKKGVRNTYQYTIHWNYEGKEYTKKEYSLNSTPDENISEVWINKDNSDAIIYSPNELSSQVYIFGLISVIAFVVWLFMYLKAETVKYDEEIALNVLIAGVLGIVLSLVAVAITAIAYNEKKDGNAYQVYTSTVMLVTSIIFLIVCLILTIMAKVETKRLSSRL
ncbi:MAG: hypothetical protein E7301_00795 [Butyrivibrio sp.]|nr:hypothetical protein [Butyrivibrio sp.]